MAGANSPSPPKDDDFWSQQLAADEAEIARITQNDAAGGNPLDGLIDNDRAIDQTGKADDAVDFEDISDEDDLPMEEEPSGALSTEVPGLTDDGGTSNDTDDLFGEGQVSSPADADMAEALAPSPRLEQDHANDRNLNFDAETDFYNEANQDPAIPGPPESFIDFVKQQWPGFEENSILDFNVLIRPKAAVWSAAKPAKPPKPLIPNKLSLELAPDQEKTFRMHGTASQPVWQKYLEAQGKGLVCCEELEPLEQADMDVFDMDDSDGETVAGFTLRDFAVVCDDWEFMLDAADAKEAQAASIPAPPDLLDEEMDEDQAWDAMFLNGPESSKRRKIEPPRGLPVLPRYVAPNFDSFQEATSKLGKRVLLDMNDPYLLVNDLESERAAKRPKLTPKVVRMVNGKSGQDLKPRFDFSNEEPYETLKENVAGKVRVTLANLNVEHSMPAQRLLWPYYNVKLPASDPHSYHRPSLQTRSEAYRPIRFSKLRNISRKSLKGLRVHEIYKNSEDISLNDNATSVLFEYSEEIPTVLSNFGMGNRVINYHRKDGKEDENPPKKPVIGELNILLPEDKSPFSIFGPIPPGETVPTLHNQMYHAPIFKHNPRPTDFLVGRSHTGQHGDLWYLRNVDHLFVVGQNLPILDIPGPHSRRVTNTAKNRLKMVAYRMLHKHASLSLGEITRHVADSHESQNRQKLKEFLDFRKDTKDWGLRLGEQLMPESAIRALVTPEDVCLMDSMQVGAHELENGGFELSRDSLGARDDDDEKEEKLAGQGNLSLAEQMVPWRTSRAFIEAAAGRAMVAVHGPGDPTGRGLGVSFIRISMKGGYLEALESIRGPQATSAGAMEREKKLYGGHLYNVRDQDKKYQVAIEKIWADQRKSLEDSVEHGDEDVQPREDEDDRFNNQSQQQQPVATPAPRGGDEFSVASRPSATSAKNQRKLKITRQIRNADGDVETHTEIVHDPVVIAQYVKRRQKIEEESINIYGGVPDQTALDDIQRDLLLKKIDAEADRLHRNKERRNKREKQKMLDQRRKGVAIGGDGGSPEPSTEKGATTRKCANCGQVGHIKTNKKLCPMLNGTIAPKATGTPGVNTPGSGSFGPINAPVAAQFLGTG